MMISDLGVRKIMLRLILYLQVHFSVGDYLLFLTTFSFDSSSFVSVSNVGEFFWS